MELELKLKLTLGTINRLSLNKVTYYETSGKNGEVFLIIVLILNKNKMIEEFKILKEFPNYLIYNNGKVYSLNLKKFLRIHKDSCGYNHVTLYKGTKKDRKTFKVHILVAKLFIPNPLNKEEVNHIDCNKNNNCVSNLEWVSRLENVRHALNNGRCIRTYLSPLQEEQVKLIPLLI